MLELGSSGSVRGVLSNEHPYRHPAPGGRRCLRSAGVSARCRLDEGCHVVGHRDLARSVDRKLQTSQLLTLLTLAMV
jgi:hypothetical protein